MAKKKKDVNKAIEKVGGLFSKKLYEKGIVQNSPITINVSLNGTVNMGNFESVRYGLYVGAQAHAPYAEEVRKELTDYVEETLSQKIKEYRGMAEGGI